MANSILLERFEPLFLQYMNQLCAEHPDPSHDVLHVQRVVQNAKMLSAEERADLAVVVPAAYLHDCVYISKADSRRSQASRISADHAMTLLKQWQYPEEQLPAIHHAIAAHSFSARIVPETLEAKIVQDADRLDAMGAIGIFRCFAFSGLAKRPLYQPVDPFCTTRTPDDSTNTLDHFFTKLLHLQEGLHTTTARLEGERRLKTMDIYLKALAAELSTN